MNYSVITVSQLNSYVKSLLDTDGELRNLFVKGEISNCRLNFSSGHYYFSLKDESATVRCAMFRSDAQRLRFRLEDGMSVLCFGRASLYERDGAYQFYISDIQPDGIGSLALQFEQTKRKLEAEGLFDSSTKRRLPRLPQKIAVLTAQSGAAVHDILNILNRRFPICDVLFVPVTVQGITAAEDMIKKLDAVYKRQDIDIIIIGRGGGSAEDLSAFNDERLARKLKQSPIPTVSAVGHESDVVITDFVADLRASTPSAAAELCVPEKTEMLQYIDSLALNLQHSATNLIDECKFRLDSVVNKKVFANKTAMIDGIINRLNVLCSNLNSAYKDSVNRNIEKFTAAVGVFEGLNPLNVLNRGYSIVYNGSGDKIKSIKKLSDNDKIKIRFADGFADCTVTATEEL